MTELRSRARWLSLAAALCLLNVALTFHNVWPTLGVRLATPVPELSAELALVLLAVLAWVAWRRQAPRHLPAALAAAWLALAIARYLEVTAPALYGRPVNLYWDLRHVGNVLRMLAESAGPARTLASAVALGLALAVAFLALRLAWARLARAAADALERGVLAAVAGGAAALWLAGLAGLPLAPASIRFSTPVSATYAHQARLVAHALGDARRAAGSRLQRSGLERAADGASDGASGAFEALGGDDLVLVFLESYGSVTYTNPGFAARLAAGRRRLARTIAASGREVVSATVTAPTFGGNSWLSHLTLLSGLEIDDPDAYAHAMQGTRPTLVRDLARAGYGTIALMPGLRQAWPEGAFYGFDAILGADALDYRGPEFGWWRIPDQYALARLDARERDARPRFVFFPTISSHAPFRPTPPYQPDWTRLTSAAPFDAAASAALAVAPEWTNLAPAYGDGIAYAFEWLAGYLERHAAADLTLIVIGDHQPPAAVAGPGSDWTVPVHVVTRRDAVRRALLDAGFAPGLEPARAPLAPMAQLRPLLTRAFSLDPR